MVGRLPLFIAIVKKDSEQGLRQVLGSPPASVEVGCASFGCRSFSDERFHLSAGKQSKAPYFPFKTASFFSSSRNLTGAKTAAIAAFYRVLKRL